MERSDLETEHRTGHRILIVDDEELSIRALELIMKHYGYSDVSSTTDPRRVLPLFRDFEPDMVLLDLRMPGLDGFSLIRQLSVRVPEGQFLPIVVVSGDLSLEARQRALALGAADFIEKPYDRTEVYLRVRNLLRTRDLTARLEERIQERMRDLAVAEVEVAKRLAFAAEVRDYRDGAHVQRVGRTSAQIARMLGLSSDQVDLIRHAAPLHDIGKIAIPDSVLLKPGVLTLEEWDLMKTHTTLGSQMLAGSRSPILQLAEEIALYHHENWDGTGYTPGLSGNEIPLAGRIVAVADVFDALTHQRPYKRVWSQQEAVEWMHLMRGQKFDPDVLDALLAILESPEPSEPLEELSTNWLGFPADALRPTTAPETAPSLPLL
jgi:putative two-component system response regulator